MRKLIISVLIGLISVTTATAQSSDDEAKNLNSLVRELTTLSRANDVADQQERGKIFHERIELADTILKHPDIEENQRVFAELTKLQSFGYLYAIDQRETKDKESESQSELLKQYQELIDRLIKDDSERITLEAISANANLATGLYVKNPDTKNANSVVSALKQLVALAPKDPIIQTTRRLLLERIWNSEEPLPLFQALSDDGDKAAAIVIPAIKDQSKREAAEFKWAKHYSKFSDFVAMHRLAKMYEQGKGTRTNNTQAARWYEKLARLGDLNALTKLGDFYLVGKGYSVDAKTAVDYYQKASTAGYRVAQFKLGECFRTGSGVEQSEENWKKWIKNAAFNANTVEVQKLYETVDFKQAPDSFQIFYDVLVDQNPGDIYYLNNLAYSLLLGSNKSPKRSLELIDEAIATAPDDFEGLANFQDTRAHALKHLGKYKEAATIFESVLDQLDDKKSILEALVECYTKIDDETKAEEYRVKLGELKEK